MAIHISDDVVLSPAEIASGINGNNPRIGFHNVTTESNVFADLEDPDFPAINMANPATYLKWKGETTTSEQSVGIILSPAETINYVAIVRHNLGTIGSEYVVEYSNNGSTWTALTTPRIPADDNVIMEEFEDTFASHFRVVMTSNGEAPEIAVLMFGISLRVQRRIYVGHAPIVFARDSTVSVGVSEEGEFLGRTVRRRMYQTSYSFKNLTPLWFRQYMDPFFHAAVADPFVIAWRPETYPEEVVYGWMQNDATTTNSLPNGFMECSFAVQGIR